MFPAASFLTLLLALSITGSSVEVRNSPITLPIVRRLNFSNGTINLLQLDKARAAALINPKTHDHARRGPVLPNVTGYTAAVGIGSPPKTYHLIVDTASSNTWLATAEYVATQTSVNTGQPVLVIWPSGVLSGTEYLDTVTLSSRLTITKQSIGVAATSVISADGVLGIGPVGLTEGTLIHLPTTRIPTVTDNLYNQSTISQHLISFSLDPASSMTDSKGELTFGGTDVTKHTGSIAYTPITATNPTSDYWGVNEGITYGSMTILFSTTGTFDSATTFILIATDALARYKSATGAVLDQKTGLLTVSSAQYNSLKNLNFHIGTEIYSLNPNAQIWPRSLNSKIGGSSGVIYLVVNDIGTPSSVARTGIIHGYTFFQRFYSVFDTANSRVGLATTSFTNANTN
ncbi:aspartic peptidase domain-containing protein [Suillus spraguei]|nr:aspartic peptidase domain-containing protein [Suillus spraguei]